MQKKLREAFFWFPSAHPFVSRGRKLRFFERAICDHFGRLALRFTVVSRFVFGARPPTHLHLLHIYQPLCLLTTIERTLTNVFSLCGGHPMRESEIVIPLAIVSASECQITVEERVCDCE